MPEMNREHIDREHVIDVLEDLIETCRDGQNGFREAAEHTKTPELRSFFNEQSLERARFAGELEDIAIHLGRSKVKREGTATGALHRAWMDLKSKLGTGDDGILAAAESGEDTAKSEYEEALQENLPEDIKATIRQQAQSIFATHDKVKMLRDRHKAA